MGINRKTISPHRESEDADPVRTPVWFWFAIALGLAIRIYFVLFSEGTYDVGILQEQAEGVLSKGLFACYYQTWGMNYPPAIYMAIAGLLKISQLTGIAFSVLIRMPTALLDAGTTALLFRICSADRRRYWIAAAYWLHPVALIISAYHGNFDSSIAFFLMACLFFLSRGNIVRAGIIIGISTWVKLPAALAVPLIFLWLPTWKQRLYFTSAAFAAGIVTYIPVLLVDPTIVLKVASYGGMIIHTTAGQPVWGTQIFISSIANWSPEWQQLLLPVVKFYFIHNTPIILTLIVILGWLRRSRRTIEGLGATLAFGYTILYGISNCWSFQYFAWSVPLWFFAGLPFFTAASILAGGYLYAVYAYLCGNLFLLGKWDFIGHPHWPGYLLLIRDVTVLFFAGSAIASMLIPLLSESAMLIRKIYGQVLQS